MSRVALAKLAARLENMDEEVVPFQELANELFDIVKPGPVSMAERLPRGLGVMADDVVAGVLAAVLLLVVQIMMTGATG